MVSAIFSHSCGGKVQDFSQLRATSRQPTSAGEKAAAQLEPVVRTEVELAGLPRADQAAREEAKFDCSFRAPNFLPVVDKPRCFLYWCRRQQIRGVERVRSVEEWAEIAVTKADYSWHGFSTQGVMNDIRGKPVVFTKRGSMFDGWAEYFLLASPAELKSADILFAKPRSYM